VWSQDNHLIVLQGGNMSNDVLRPSLQPTYEVNVTEGIQYGEADVDNNGVVSKTPLYLDIYQPVGAGDQLRPLIVIIHGGAFIRGSRQDANLVKAAQGYASRGYNVASISYRLGAGPEFMTMGKVSDIPIPSQRVEAYNKLVNGVDSIRFLDFMKDAGVKAQVDQFARVGQVAALDDSLMALDWLVDHASDYSFDLSRMVLFGGSAGFINSLHVAYAVDDLGISSTSRIAAVLGFWGAFNLDDDDVSDDGPVFLEAGEAPLFVVHGTGDEKVPASYGEALVKRANEVGVPVEFIPIAGGKHGFNSINIFDFQTDNGQSIYDRTIAFLDRILFS